MEKATKNQELLPVSLLHLVVRFGENLFHGFFDKFLEKTMENYPLCCKILDDRVNAYLDMGMNFPNLTGKSAKNLVSLLVFC